MERQSPHRLLRIPVATRQSLTLCEGSAKGLSQWLDALPKANLGETARLLYQMLTELNETTLPAGLRLEMLELLRPEIANICACLDQHIVSQTASLDAQERKIVALCQSLQNHLAGGYKLVLVTEIEENPGKASLTLRVAIERAIRALYASLIRVTQIYSPVPEGCWLELHLLYELARMNNIDRLAVEERQTPSGSTTIEQAYLAALLLGCSRCNQLRPRSIALLGQMLETWSALARLQAATETSSLFVVTPPIDGAPRYRSLVPASTLPGWLGIDTKPLNDAIEEHLKHRDGSRHLSSLPRASEVPVDLLTHLYSAWGGMTDRSLPRTPSRGTLTICIGMSAVHYYLAGMRDFDEMVKFAETRRKVVFDRSGSDVWASAFDARDRGDSPRQLERIDFRDTPIKKGLDRNAAYPTHELSTVDESLDGYCLAWDTGPLVPLQVGEPIAVRLTDDEWLVAAVRWIRKQADGLTQAGIQLLGPHAQPCAVRMIHKEKTATRYQRALLLPENNTLKRAATLIAPQVPFQEGNKVSILDNQYEYRALLTKRIGGTPSFSQFEYQSLEMGYQDAPPNPAKKPTPGAEDFDSIWKSL